MYFITNQNKKHVSIRFTIPDTNLQNAKSTILPIIIRFDNQPKEDKLIKQEILENPLNGKLLNGSVAHFRKSDSVVFHIDQNLLSNNKIPFYNFSFQEKNSLKILIRYIAPKHSKESVKSELESSGFEMKIFSTNF